MAGLRLTNALRDYQQGVAWKENQDAMTKQKRQRDQINEANKAAAGVVDSTRAQYLLDGGDPDKFRPDENTILKGLDARTNVLAKHGRWDDVVQNEAKATGLRTNIRNNAIDKAMLDYQQTQDPISLAQAVYPHVYDGREIKFAKKLEDGTIEFSLSDGEKSAVKPEMIPEMVQRMRMNPAEVAKLEFQSRMKNLEAQFAAEQKKGVIKAQGDEDRTTEGVKQNNRLGLASVQNGYRLAEIGASGEQARRTKATPSYSDTTFTLGEGQQRFTLGKDGKPSLLAAGSPKSDKTDWADMSQRHFGKLPTGSVDGRRMADPMTLKLAEAASSIYEVNTKAGKSINPEQAMRLAAQQLGISGEEEN